MAEAGYEVHQAASDLAAADLLAGGLWARQGRWHRLQTGPGPSALVAADTESSDSALAGSFLGATLDSRQVMPGCLFVALAGKQTDGRRYVKAALEAGAVVLTRAWSEPTADPVLSEPAPPRGLVLLSHDPVASLGLLAAKWRSRQPVQVTAVTGSNGKTTTKDLLAACLRGGGETWATTGNLNNELGLPLTLLGLRASHRFAAVEIGASAVGDIAGLAAMARPEIGVITNAAAAHLAQFGSLAGVVQGKGELVEALPSDGIAVLNADSPGFANWVSRAPCPVVSFGCEAGEHRWSWQPGPQASLGDLILDGEHWSVPLPGRHNGANLVAALLAARANGLDDVQIRAGLTGFKASPQRGHLQQLAGRWLLDDSYNANPTSMVSAAEALVALPAAGRRVAALGFMAELGPDSDALHRQTGRRLREVGIDLLLAVGPQASELAVGFAAAGGQLQTYEDQVAAAAWLVEHTAAGDALLVKGSRAAAMEKLVTALVEHLRAQEING